MVYAWNVLYLYYLHLFNSKLFLSDVMTVICLIF